MRRRFPGLLIWLVLLWLLLWGEFTWANLLSGLVVGILFLIGSGLGREEPENSDDRPRIAPWHLVKFSVVVLFMLIQSNLILAREILKFRTRTNSGVIAVPLRTDSTLPMLVVANVITLTPGTLTIESRGSPATLYVNVLQLHDPEKVRAELLRIETLAVEAFGSRHAREQLAQSREVGTS